VGQAALKNIPTRQVGAEAEQATFTLASETFTSARLPERGRVAPSEVLGSTPAQVSNDDLIAAGRRENFSRLFTQYANLSDVVSVQPDKFFMFVNGNDGPRILVAEGEQPVRLATKADVAEPKIARLLNERFTSLKAA
jgi:hypothetical protein